MLSELKELLQGIYMPLLKSYAQRELWVSHEDVRVLKGGSTATNIGKGDKDSDKFLDDFGELLNYVTETIASFEDRVELVEVPFAVQGGSAGGGGGGVGGPEGQENEAFSSQQGGSVGQTLTTSQQNSGSTVLPLSEVDPMRTPGIHQNLLKLEDAGVVDTDIRTTMKEMSQMWAGSITQAFVESCEKNVAIWCNLIERALVIKEVDVMAVLEDDSVGPASELIYWKARTARLCSITDQLKYPSIRRIVGTVQANGERSLKKRWASVDLQITEAANEAKDNTKYLATFDQLAKPLYKSDPPRIVESLSPLINAVKTLQSIAKFYSTPERMLALFVKITNQMIVRCREYILEGGEFWDQDRKRLIEKIKHCIDLSDVYADHFHHTQAQLRATLGGHQFDFPEDVIFGKFRAFCNRLLKLMDMLRSAHQFSLLTETQATIAMPGLADLTEQFLRVFKAVQKKKSTGEGSRERNLELLDPRRAEFEVDYLVFTRTVLQLETQVQELINRCFETVSRTTSAVRVLEQFKTAFRRGNLEVDLDSKYIYILQVYAKDLEVVRKMYGVDKDDPPKPRNDPPAAGAIAWARQLHRRIEGPMKLFSVHPYILGLPEAKPTIVLYNKVAKALVKYEDLWHESWLKAVAAAKQGLHATLLVRHPKTKRLYVNFDRQILQVIRECLCMRRLGLDVPADMESLVVQERDLKRRAEYLGLILERYTAALDSLPDHWIPLLKPRLSALRGVLEPGYTQLTWGSVSTDSYISSLAVAVTRLTEVIERARAIETHRIEPDLALASSTMLMAVPDVVLPADEYIGLVRSICSRKAVELENKNMAIETAVYDLLDVLCEGQSEEEVELLEDVKTEFVEYYQGTFYEALLACLRTSMKVITDRFAIDDAFSTCWILMPLFSMSIDFQGDRVVMRPSLDEIELITRQITVTMLSTFQEVYIWGQDRGAAAAKGKTDHLVSYYSDISKDFKIAVMLLMLRGTFEGLTKRVHSYINVFLEYSKLWRWNCKDVITAQMNPRPSTAVADERFTYFETLSATINSLPDVRNMAALTMKAQGLKKALFNEAERWRLTYGYMYRAIVLQDIATFRAEIDRLNASLAAASFDDFNDLAMLITILDKVRSIEATFDSRYFPIEEMYQILEKHGIPIFGDDAATAAGGKSPGDDDHLTQGGGGGSSSSRNDPSSSSSTSGGGRGTSGGSSLSVAAAAAATAASLVPDVPQSAADPLGDLLNAWKVLRARANTALSTALAMQSTFRSRLENLIETLHRDVRKFATEYEAQGPMQKGLKPSVASDRLLRFSNQYDLHRRKAETYNSAETLFGLPVTDLPLLVKVGKEIKLLTPLYTLYTDVLAARRRIEEMLFSEADFEKLEQDIKDFDQKCRSLPKGLRDWEAYADLKKVIDDLNTVLPLMQDLADPSMRARHWEMLTAICRSAGYNLVMDHETVRLQDFLNAPLLEKRSEIEDMCYSAKKEAEIESKLKGIAGQWNERENLFSPFRNRGFLLLKADDTLEILTELEESELILAGLLGSRYVKPFRRETESWIAKLTTCTDITEKWLQVQNLWVYLEAVFSGGDIARQLPLEARRFQGIDKQWVKVMGEAYASPNMIICCSGRDTLKSMLPMLLEQMEISQKSLEGYLEIKRNLFPRFYFVSNPVLLEILGHSSEPQAIQPHLKSVFDNIAYVHFSKAENVKNTIEAMESSEGEKVSLVSPLLCDGNVEAWLLDLEGAMRTAVKAVVKDMILDLFGQGNMTPEVLFRLLLKMPAQVALLGLQIHWTTDVDYSLKRAATEVNIMKNTDKRIKAQLKELTRLTTEEWSREARVKIESLVTILVHQRDVFEDTLVRRSVKSHMDFEWLKQTRFYWREEQADIEISVCDISVEYCYEYLGCTDRLVITPLTDRCYITLSQALGMNMGGAPAGPAGTGKTETVKDMGKALGKFVIVFNCSDQVNEN